jgi:hypothetical protein
LSRPKGRVKVFYLEICVVDTTGVLQFFICTIPSKETDIGSFTQKRGRQLRWHRAWNCGVAQKLA